MAQGSPTSSGSTATVSAKGASSTGKSTTPIAVKVLGAVIALGIFVYFCWLLLDAGGENVARDLWLFTGLLLMMVGLIGWKAVSSPSRRVPWALLAIGLFVWTVADVYYTGWVSVMDEPPYPSIADWMYLAFYPFAFIAVTTLLMSRVKRPPLWVWLDALLVALGVAAYLWLIGPDAFSEQEASAAANFMNMANPASDMILICLLLGILGVVGWKFDRQWLLLLLAALVLWMVDTAWMLGVAESSYNVGAIIDVGWPVAFAILTCAAWQGQGQPLGPVVGLRSALVPLVVIVFALALLLYGTQQSLPLVSALLASLAIIVGAIRSSVAFKQASVEAEAQRLAHTDSLTGLGNRRLLDESLEIAVHQTLSGQTQKCALLLLDIDSFKEINDSLGHRAGDVVLQSVSQRLMQAVHVSDTVARLGGDEFAILLRGDDSDTRSMAVAESILRESVLPLAVGPVDLHVAMSIGIAHFPNHTTSAEDLLQAADVAMYRAKSSRSGYAVFEQGQGLEERRKLLLTHELRAAVMQDQLFCEFQPKVDVLTGDVIDVEALVRWRHPHLGVLDPDAFLSVAEKAGLMGHLTHRVLDEALAQAARWRAEGLPSAVAVNLSVTNLIDQHLPTMVSQMLETYQVPPAELTLEITETVLITEPILVQQVVGELHDMGVVISIDDYGTGYSSLVQLRRLKARELKLDHSLVTGLKHRSDIRAIVHATVGLAHELGLRMVAEGVESVDDLTELRALHCDVAQGFFICRPTSGERLTQWLRDDRSRQFGVAAIPGQAGKLATELSRPAEARTKN